MKNLSIQFVGLDMFLRKAKKLLSKISYRLAFAYIVFFIPCYMLTFGLFYYFSSHYLERRDRDVIEARLQQIEQLIGNKEIAGLKAALSEEKFHNQINKLLIYISDSKQNTQFLHLPEDSMRFELPVVEEFLKKRNLNFDENWFNIASKEGDDDALEVKAVRISGDGILMVGASTDERDEILERFQEIFLTIFFPLVLFSSLGSVLISQKILLPLAKLSKSISEVKSGHLGSRVELPLRQDELYDLSQTYNEMADQTEKLVMAIKQTVDNIAHDLKTPMTRIRIASAMALQKNTHAELKEAVEETIESTESILAMIQAILEMAKYNTKTVALDKSWFAASVLIAEVVDLYFFVADDKNINIEVECELDQVFADRIRLKQILANLLDNAIKYSPGQSSINILALEEEHFFVFKIKDRGVGISIQDRSRIWERLFRADKSRSEPGLGLGLSLVKVYAEAHGGLALVQSELGQGSEFLIKIPKA